MSNAHRDENRITTMLGVDSATFTIPKEVAVNPTTHAMLTEATMGLQLKPYDYVSMTIAPAGTETWVFKSGGSTGTTVNTVVIVYTDATRADISTVTKT